MQPKKPFRILRRIAQLQRARRQRSALVLMYHRISDEAPKPNWLAVSPRNFELQLEYICQHLNPISLLNLADAVHIGNIPPRSVAVTFDDGYYDNYANALPLLEAAQIPATIFVTSGFIDREEEFWWDELARFVLEHETVPSELSLEIQDQVYTWESESAVQRQHVYSDLKELIKPLSHSAKSTVMCRIAEWAGVNGDQRVRPTYRTLTTPELIGLARSDYIEIGAHTVTHPILSTLQIKEQQNEIAESRRTLELVLDQPVQTFAYPNGDFSEETVKAVRDAGFIVACTTKPGIVVANADLFRLNRHTPNDYGIDTFAQNIAEWFGWSQ